MKHTISAGVITYRIHNNQREYLLIKSRKGHWDFPKGKQDADESVVQTALRETYEETGLVPTLITSQPLQPQSWSFIEQGITYHKTGIFFVGHVDEQASVVLSHEHVHYVWLTYQDAYERLHHATSRLLLAEANKLLQEKI